MKILVFSDSHGNVMNMRKVMDFQQNYIDCVFHAGDGTKEFLQMMGDYPNLLKSYVLGNNTSEDFMYTAPESETCSILNLGDIKVLLTHGHRFGVKHSIEKLVYFSREKQVDLTIFGHTHEPYQKYLPGNDIYSPLTLFNPGSISRSYDGKPSYGIVEIVDKKVLTSVVYL